MWGHCSILLLQRSERAETKAALHNKNPGTSLAIVLLRSTLPNEWQQSEFKKQKQEVLCY